MQFIKVIKMYTWSIQWENGILWVYCNYCNKLYNEFTGIIMFILLLKKLYNEFTAINCLVIFLFKKWEKFGTELQVHERETQAELSSKTRCDSIVKPCSMTFSCSDWIGTREWEREREREREFLWVMW